MRYEWESNPRIEVLQTSALPLGHRTVLKDRHTIPQEQK